MLRKDYYAILGIPRTASENRIREAYRDLAKRFHPDLAGRGGASRFRDVREAYETLSDPRLRSRYNHELGEPVAVQGSGPPPRAEEVTPTASRPLGPEEPWADPISLTRDFDTLRPSFEALFDRLIHDFTGTGAPKGERVEPLTLEVILSPEEAARGGVLPVDLPVFRHCAACGGRGQEPLLPCPACEGRGVERTELPVRVTVPAGVRDHEVIETGLEGIGISSLYLRLHFRVAG
jgi:molecular chaperone DnaJ